jgi:antitoxin component of MazEF toxin-antitoxin module
MSKALVEEASEHDVIALTAESLRELGVRPGDEVEVMPSNERTLLLRRFRPKYTIDEILDRCDPRAFERTPEDEEWLNMPSVGRELL